MDDTGDKPHVSMRRTQRFRQVPVRYLLPNLITLLALASGVTAIRLGIEGRYELAVAAVIVAIVLDAMDGRLARFLKGTSRFGAELDSLADFLNFGVAPAILIYLWSLNAMRGLGWLFALSFAICCALRLARFNVALDDPDKPAWAANYFTGAPAPAGAGLAMLPMYVGFLGYLGDGHDVAWLIAPYIALIALFMVSRIPTFSGKTLSARIPRDMVLPILGLVVLTLILLVTYPWHTLTLLGLAYLVMVPFGVRSWRRHVREEQAAREASPEQK